MMQNVNPVEFCYQIHYHNTWAVVSDETVSSYELCQYVPVIVL
jgi:hypothetical protein